MRKFYIIVSLFLCVNIFAQEDYKILSSSTTSLIVEFTPNYLEQQEISINGEKYIDIDLLNGVDAENNEIGLPINFTRVFNIGVPAEFGNSIKVNSTSFETINGQLKPNPNVRKKNGFPLLEYVKSSNYIDYKSPELVSFGKFGLVRDVQVQSINVHPIQFDPKTNEIKLYKRIVFQIDFVKQKNVEPILKSELTNDVVINFNVAKKWGVEKNKLFKTNTNSVLANGNWYRFEAPEECIYQIDRNFLIDLGIDVQNIDPRTIKIYNNGGYILNWKQTADRPNGLEQIAITVSGESDGSFDNNDKIFFYGRGVDFWEYDKINKKLKRNKHFYSKKNYYWLTYGGNNGKRMEAQESESGTAIVKQTVTKAFRVQDNDNQNLIGSGLLHVDDDYSSASNSKTYTHMLDGLLNGSAVNYTIQFINASKNKNKLDIKENGNTLFSGMISGYSKNYYPEYRYGEITRLRRQFSGDIKDNRSVLKFTFTPSSISDKGHLDYIEIEYEQDLFSKTDDIPVLIFSTPVNGIVNYTGSPFNSSNFKIYNVTDYSNPKIITTIPNGGNFDFSIMESSDQISKYIAVKDDIINSPINGEKIANSNISGISPGAKYLVITAREFEEQANRLIEYRRNQAEIKISSELIFIDEIYNEFSGGSLDPTAIRDFLMFAYKTWEVKPEYVLLFGDGDYDYFNTTGKGLNFIPTFQSKESLFELSSYPQDDFYSRIVGDDVKADLAIGRLSITTPEEAKSVVDKIISYEQDLDKGLWRNRISLLADDGLTSERNEYSEHTSKSEALSNFLIPESYDRKKIYLSNYQTVNTGLGRRKPDCNTAIIDAINNGTLIFNYYGHGNPDVWAHEIVFDRSTSIPQLRNKELFFLTAATCDFGKYDDPNLQSAAEEMILMENYGMIGGISAVRPVFSSSNHALNTTFYKYMLGEKDSLGFPIPIGKAYMKLKQVRTDANDKKFHLFADPYLRLNIPRLPVEITSINGINIIDTINIKALSRVTIKGKVNGNNLTNSLSGEGIVTVFDSERIIHLDDINYDMIDQGGVIFRGRVSVENGEFTTSFTVPKDISYENKNGKIIAYFFNDEIDGVGYTNNIIVGGTDSSNVNDGEGPEIEILYDDETESSYLVGQNFKLRVKLYDETGLNTTSTGIGHKLEAILNDDEQNSIDLTNFFIGDLNSGGRSGEVSYNFSSMEPGEYKIKVNAWDVFNNFSSQENYFTVVDENKLVVREVYNYPNPFSSNTYFTFQHNLTKALNVEIRVYTIAGRFIKKIESFNVEDKFVKIAWNGKDSDNNKVGNGTYLYKIIVETVDGEYKENILGKMAVIR